MRFRTALAISSLAATAACADTATSPTTPAKAARPLASITLKYPAEDPGPPFYTLVERGFLPHTDDWAPIIFVRDPACVPSGFNLLDQLAVPQAFGCALNVEGHVTYKNGPPPIDPAPWQVVMRDAGPVPVWFVPWSSLQGAIADDVLTLAELESMPGARKGAATFFEMTQQIGVMRPQGTGNGKIELTARGALDGGQSFSIELREMGVDKVSTLRHIRIEFR